MENLSKYLPAPEMMAEFEEFKKLQTTEEKKNFQKIRIENFEKKSQEEKEAYIEASKMGLNAISERVDELSEKVKLGEVANIVSVSYISKKYFGKTRHWLYQRLNGSIVNGKPARLTSDEKKKLQEALLDISTLINETSLKIA